MEFEARKQFFLQVKVTAGLMVVMGFAVLVPEYGIHVLFLFSIGFFVAGAWSILKYKDTENWKESVATIKTVEECSEEVWEERSCKTFYFPKIEYVYNFEDKYFESDKVSLEKKNIWKTKIDVWGYEPPGQKWWWRGLKPGDKLQVFINPNDYKDSVLIKELSKLRGSHYKALVASGLLLGIICVLLYRAT